MPTYQSDIITRITPFYAIQYTQSNGEVTAILDSSGHDPLILVQHIGIGIAPQYQAKTTVYFIASYLNQSISHLSKS